MHAFLSPSFPERSALLAEMTPLLKLHPSMIHTSDAARTPLTSAGDVAVQKGHGDKMICEICSMGTEGYGLASRIVV